MRETARVQVIEPGLSTVQDLGRAGGPRYGPDGGRRPRPVLRPHGQHAGRQRPRRRPPRAGRAGLRRDHRRRPAGGGHRRRRRRHRRRAPAAAVGAGRLAGGHPARRAPHPLRAAGLPRRARPLDTRRLLGSCAPDTVLGFGAPLGAGAVLTAAVDCPPVVQPWFDIPFFRLGARPHPYSRAVERRPDRRPGRRRVRPDRGAAVPTPTTSSAPAATTSGCASAAPTAGRCPAAPSRPRCCRAACRSARSRCPTGDELLVLHRGRGVTAGYPVLAVVTAWACPASGRPAPARPSASATSPAPPRSRTTGAGRPTSPRSGPASRPSTPARIATALHR